MVPNVMCVGFDPQGIHIVEKWEAKDLGSVAYDQGSCSIDWQAKTERAAKMDRVKAMNAINDDVAVPEIACPVRSTLDERYVELSDEAVVCSGIIISVM
jgi:hypothetical protein